jgi:hypothetical protein
VPARKDVLVAGAPPAGAEEDPSSSPFLVSFEGFDFEPFLNGLAWPSSEDESSESPESVEVELGNGGILATNK